MKTVHKEELYIKKDNLTEDLFTERSIFFDIETTGFSPSNASVYLIGCARKRGLYICTDQFFAENPGEEEEIIRAFFEILKNYKTIISFNGAGFDIPFLKAKCSLYGIDETFTGYSILDMFKSVSKLKGMLNLENYKQRTVEKFLGIDRDDKYSGGELINVYYEYVKKPSDELFDLLMLHNYDDVKGMMDLLPVLSYNELIKGHFSLDGYDIDDYTAMDGSVRKELFIRLKNDHPLPKSISFKAADYYIKLSKESAMIRIPIYEGELKFFYPNYKDYYYLPKEDLAMHKSVAEYVDRNFREKCHAYNCYTKKYSQFLCQQNPVISPSFKNDYKDQISYFELTDSFLESEELITKYIKHILLCI